ncbi:hypothetical protein [Pontibacter populi]|uniref:YcxB-like protein domain-containing protein n=1 Tax=Pontibacter populi TaxID=890055 RepID=A0ABV1RT74_9BACT
MEYNIKFISGNRLIALGTIGVILSIAIPIYLRINFSIGSGLMGGLIFSGILLSFLFAYLNSKRNEYFVINEQGMTTRKYGEIKWEEVLGLNLDDRDEHEVFTIKLKSNHKISIPSKIDDSLNRKIFVAFQEEVTRRVAENKKSGDEVLQYSSTYDGKVYRYIAFAMAIVLILVTLYVLYLIITGEITLKTLSAVFLIYASCLPLIIKVAQAKMVKSKHRRG